MNSLNFSFESIVTDWIPYGFAIVGVIAFVIGVFRLISGKEGAFNTIFTSIVVIVIAILFRLAMINFVLPNL